MEAKTQRINDFLRLIKEIKDNGVLIDSNLVYSNLINIGSKKEPINKYFAYWKEKFNKNKNVHVYNDAYYCHFDSPTIKNDAYNMLKIYIPMDKDHMYNGINSLFDYIAESGITYHSKITSDTRIDDVVLKVDSIASAEKIRNFINHEDYIKKGLINTNPFTVIDNNISYTWEGKLSYNLVVSDWISRYINKTNKDISCDNFLEYICNKYNDVFIEGNNINKFSNEIKNIDGEQGLLNYQRITEILIMSLNNISLKDFYTMYQSIIDKEKSKNKLLNIKKLVEKDKENNIEINNEDKEVFDYAFIQMCKNEDLEKTVKRFKNFINTGSYLQFTKKNNIRQLMIENMTREKAKELMLEEQKQILTNASLETMNKYDSIQLSKALFSLKYGNYNGFTNENNYRNYLKAFIGIDEIDNIVHRIIIDEGYNDINSDDEYWLYLELVQQMNKNKKI